jgi:putative ABC transport system ATP-binding protein
MIELVNVTKTFGKKQQLFTALKNITLTIPDKQTVAITGKSGSGKSTLMHVMSGLDHVTNGIVKINGQEIGKMSTKQIDNFRATEMSFIFQAFFVEANQTCLYNVLLPLEIANVPSKNRTKMARQALESVGLSDKTNVQAKNLSGGQKQRLAIARAIVNKPKLIFADEPTGNLDSTTGELVTELLFELNRKLGSTLVIVTHDEELAAKCSQRVVLKDGELLSLSTKKTKVSRKAATR